MPEKDQEQRQVESDDDDQVCEDPDEENRRNLAREREYFSNPDHWSHLVEE
jgi:hypothetical protein